MAGDPDTGDGMGAGEAAEAAGGGADAPADADAEVEVGEVEAGEVEAGEPGAVVPRPQRRGWQAGRSGNPQGRPRLGTPREAERMRRLAFRNLCEIADNKRYPATARVSAAAAILLRTDGRPPACNMIAPPADAEVIAQGEQQRRQRIEAWWQSAPAEISREAFLDVAKRTQ